MAVLPFFVQLYNEDINDLLAPDNLKLPIHESKESGVYVAGLREDIVVSVEQVMQLLSEGEANRHIGATKMNEGSSRSHTVFRMVSTVSSMWPPEALLAAAACATCKQSMALGLPCIANLSQLSTQLHFSSDSAWVYYQAADLLWCAAHACAVAGDSDDHIRHCFIPSARACAGD